ncbi:MAG: DUF456 domain-containing protein [Planctomycetales bacterium]|nr:DUF456 domain-containing protein [Planctomycetales bacterium]
MNIFGWQIDLTWTYYLAAFILLMLNGSAWALNFVTLPGNWIIVILTALFALLFGSAEAAHVSWWCVLGLIFLAVVGEVVEFLAGAAGAAKHGASRRAMLLSLFGSIVGSFAGVILGSWIPIVGSAIGAVLLGAGGAFAGGYFGEQWRGTEHAQRVAVGQGALFGRLFGTVGKILVGAIMVGLATVDSFF